jgi:murein DD-endopeptidase MepM/ murein hydrolase activator NlpD
MRRAAFLLALMTTACATGQPAPISYGGGAGEAPQRQAQSRQRPPIEIRNQPRQQQPRQAAQAEPVRTPEAQPQPTPDWAEGEGTPLSAYALQPENAQPFDPARLPGTHRVGPNDSLYDIAATYQVPLRALIDQNNLEPPYALTPGSELRLPPPRLHRVARGETLRDIAERYNVDFRSLALLNRLQPPYDVRQGESVVLPAMARAAEPVAPPQPSPSPAPAPANGAARFAWPMRGDVVARYGAQAGGGRLDGIEIAGREGDQIAAAADGEVVYAGDDLPAYGTLVLIRHPDGYVTAYAHARRALVRERQSVRAGQAIAELGARPDGRSRLMFQVRRGSDVVDPAPLLVTRN